MMEEKDKLEKIDRELIKIEEHIHNLEKELKRFEEKGNPQKLSFEDVIQELAGAVVVALTVSLSDEIWDLAKRLSFTHALSIYLFVLVVANVFVAYGNKKGWIKQQVFGFIQLRLLTSAVISFLVASFVVLLLGIYPNFVETFGDYLKLVLLISSFSLIGSLGLDMAK
jgi:uncharacterized membrane protein